MVFVWVADDFGVMLAVGMGLLVGIDVRVGRVVRVGMEVGDLTRLTANWRLSSSRNQRNPPATKPTMQIRTSTPKQQPKTQIQVLSRDSCAE